MSRPDLGEPAIRTVIRERSYVVGASLFEIGRKSTARAKLLRLRSIRTTKNPKRAVSTQSKTHLTGTSRNLY